MPAPHELLGRVVQELPVAVIVAEAPSGRLILGNAAVDEVWRAPFRPAEAVEGYAVYVGFHPDGRPYRPEEWPLARAVSTGEVVRGEEIEIARGDDTRGIIDCSAAPLRDEAGEIVAGFVVFQDVTDARRAERALSILAQAGRALQGADVESVLAEVARLCVPALADGCGVYLVEPDGMVSRHGAFADEEDEALLAEADPAVFEQLTRTPGALDDLERLLPSSSHVVPLVARERQIGALALFNLRGRRRWEADEQELAAELGRRCAVAIDLAQVLEDQRRTALTLQTALLPPALPDIPGFEVAARYLPADGRHLVGGDFYDAVATPGGWLLAVGDVCGKGIDAAVLTALARHSIRTAVHYEDGPGGVLGALNRALREHDPSRALLTATVAHLDAGGGLRVATGGHPPPLLRRADGRIEALEGAGLMLGVADDEAYRATDARLEPGDTLLLYTDGVTEARTATGFFGEQGLADLLIEPGEVDEIVARVADALSGPGVRRRDDVALVALRRADAG